MLPTLSRFCHLLERELLIAIRRRRYTFQIAPIYSKSKSFKSRDPLLNQMLSKKNGAVRERRQSWLVDEKVCMHLREEILLKPKFVRQMVMSIPVLESTELDKVLSRCKEDLQNLSVVDDLHSLLSDIIMVINHLDKNHVMPLLEEKCCLRLSSWTVKEILWTMDMFYACQWKAARFYRSSFKWFDLKLSDLDIQPDDLVQLLFYVAFYRNAPITLMRQIEEILAHQSELHSPAELGLICHAFFVTNTSILSHDLLEMLSCKLIEGISNNRLKPALIGNYLKVLRHAQYEDGVLYQQICDGFVRRFNRLNRYATMQLFKLLSSLHFYHGDYCATFVKYWESVDLHRAAPRFKTLVDILSSCIVFQVKPPENVINQMMDVVETRHRELSNLYPEKYIESLVALVQTDRFPFEAISHALSPRVEKDSKWILLMYDRQSKELSQLQKRILTAESQVNDFQARLSDAVGQRKHWEDEYNKLKKEYDAIVKQLAACQKQLECEMVKRVDLENKIQSLKEELTFKSQVHEQEINETISRTRVEVEEVDGRLQEDYDSRLADALREMREQNDEMIRMTRDETAEMFERKLAELRALAEKNDTLAARSQEEIATFRRRISDLTSELNKLRNQTAAQESRISDLEQQLKSEQSEHKTDVDRRDAEIRRLRQSLEDHLAEYQDLLDVKVQLDIEIMAYRKLLEGGESRLNISQGSDTSARRTPSRGMPLSRKRKRLLVESGESSSVPGLSQISEKSVRGGYSSTSSAKGIVEIYEVDTDGKFIKLHNSSEDKDQTLGGWLLKMVVGGEEVVYKFHRTSHVKAGQYVTVWSADQEATHQPPTDLVMKGQKWGSGESMKAVLVNGQGEEMASRELKHTEMRTSYMRSSTFSVAEGEFVEEGSGHEGRDSEGGQRPWFWWRK